MKQKFLSFFLSLVVAANVLYAQQADNKSGGAGRADTSLQFPRTLVELRSDKKTNKVGNSYFVPDSRGIFAFDPKDRVSTDDSVMTLVTAGGLRYKRVIDQGILNVQWFGATGNGSTDDAAAIQKGINYIINNANATGRTLYFPPGAYKISRPLLIARPVKNGYLQSSINLAGPSGSRDLAAGSARILPAFNNSFAIGVQSGKGVSIRGLVIRGQFIFPNKLNFVQTDTLSFDEWTDGACRQNTMSPYAGIVIDPFSSASAFPNNSDMYPNLHDYYPPAMSRSGSTEVQIVGCSIVNFIVGVMITPSKQQNGELIDVIDCDISYNKVGYAMGQAQSKECHVQRIKCWGPTHTLFDNITYGVRQGDGAAVPMVDGVNVAGMLKQLCRINAPSFGGSFRNVYAEGLFRLGYVGGSATVSFEDCQFNFASLPEAFPYPDFFVLGSGASFYGCMLRYYTGQANTRLILSGTNGYYQGGTMNAPPVTVNLNGCTSCMTPTFKNVVMYNSGGVLGNSNTGLTRTVLPPGGSNGKGSDPVYPGNTYLFADPFSGTDLLYRFTYNYTYERTVTLTGKPVIHVNKTNWTAYFKLAAPSDANVLRPGDFILTSQMAYQDQYTTQSAGAHPVGLIQDIRHDTVFLAHLAYGINEGVALLLWSDYYIYQKGPLTGDMAAGSDLLVKAQGAYPSVGERLDMPMLPAGAYVAALDTAARTIRFSCKNNTGQSYTDYTIINGYPAVEMRSAVSLSELANKFHKTLIGGADFYQFAISGKDIHEPAYLLGNTYLHKYKNINTNIKGDVSLHKLLFTLVP